MANKQIDPHKQTHSESERAECRNRKREQEPGGEQWQVVGGGGKVKDKRNRVHENYWIPIQPKVAATK